MATWNSYNAGTAHLTIEPYFGNLFPQIDARVREHNAPAVQVPIVPENLASFRTRLQTELSSLDIPDVPVGIRLDLDNLQQKINAAVAAAGNNVDINVDVDTTAATAGLGAFISFAESESVAIKVDVDTTPAMIALGSFRQFAESQAINVKVNVDTASAQAQLASLNLGDSTVTTNVRLDLVNAYDRLNTFRAYASRDIRIQVDLDVTGALAGLVALNALAHDLDSRLRNLPNVGNLGGNLGGLGGGGGGGGDGAGGFGGFIKGMGLVSALAPVAIGAVGALGAGIAGIATVAAPAGAALAVGLTGIFGAFEAGAAMADSAGEDAEAAADKQEAAAKQVESAERSLADAYDNAAQTAKDGNRQIEDAEDAVQDAQKRSQDAQEDLTRARKDAQEQIEDLNLALKGSALDEESAILSVERAAERLRETMSDPKASGLDRKEADLNHRQAIQRLAEVRERNVDLREETESATVAGVEGSEQVLAAKEAIAAAAEGEADAERNLADTREDVARANEQAQQRIVDAQEQLAEAQEAQAEALTELSSKAEEYEKALEKLSPAARAFVEQMRGMKDVWKDFAGASQEALFTGLGDSIANAAGTILPAITDEMAGISGSLGEMFGGLFDTLAEPGNIELLEKLLTGTKDMMDQIGPSLASGAEAFLQFSANAVDSIGPLIESLGNLLGPLFSLVGELAVTFAPLLTELFNALGPVITELIPPFKEIAEVVGRALVDTIIALTPAIGPLLDAFASLFAAVAPMIPVLAEIVTSLVVALAPALSAIFDALAPVIEQFADAMLPVIEELAPILADVAMILAEALITGLEAILPSLPILADSFAQIVLAIAPFLPQLAEMVQLWLPPLMALFNDLIVTYLPPLTAGFLWLAENVLPVVIDAVRNMAEEWGEKIESVRTTFNDVKDWLVGAFDTVRTNVGDFVDRVGELWDGLREKLAAPVNFVIREVWNEGIVKLWNDFGPKVGLGTLDTIDEIRVNSGGKSGGRFADGGAVYGAGGPKDDAIPAWLSNGEHVLTAEDVQNLGGHDAVYDLRKGAASGVNPFVPEHPNYANGGAVAVPKFAVGGGVAFGSDADRWMAKVIQEAFPDVTVTSALRSGHSGFHGRGQAIDIDGPSKQQYADWIFKAYPQSEQLIWGPGPLLYNVGGNSITDQAQLANQVYAGDLPGHFDHVHWGNDTPLEALSGEERESLWAWLKSGASSAISFARDLAADQFEKPLRAIGDRIPDPFSEGLGEFGHFPKLAYDTLSNAAIDWVRGKADEKDRGSAAAGLGGFGGNSMDYAAAIVEAAKQRGLGPEGAKVGLMTALAESNLRMWANSAVPESLDYPHDAVGSDHDSIGLFQQRNNGAWGTVEQRMNPQASAGMFFDALSRIEGWQDMAPHEAAQAVQASAFSDGSNYAAYANQADALTGQLYDAGGVMEPNSLAVNLSGKPEAVFTNEEWQVLDAFMSIIGQPDFIDRLAAGAGAAPLILEAPAGTASGAATGGKPSASGEYTPQTSSGGGALTEADMLANMSPEARKTFEENGEGAGGAPGGDGFNLASALQEATGITFDERPQEERMAEWSTTYTDKWANWGRETASELVDDAFSPLGLQGISIGQMVTQDVPDAMTRLARLADMSARGYTRTMGR